MKRAQLLLVRRGLSLLVVASALIAPATARADDPYGLGPGAVASSTLPTWGNAHALYDPAGVAREAPVMRARQLLTRARLLDETATADEKAATELVAKLAPLRTAAKAARDHAEKASVEDKEALGARADDLETDVIVSEAEVTFKRKTAANNRRYARELRARAVMLATEAPLAEEPAALACDPPFRFTPDGRKIYRIECLK